MHIAMHSAMKSEMDSVELPSAREVDELMRAIADAVARPPDFVAASGRSVFTWRTVDAELAELLEMTAELTGDVATRDVDTAARAVFAAIARRDLLAIAGALHPDDEQEFMPLGRFVGRADVLGVFEQLFASFPDIAVAVEDVFSARGRAYVRWHARGTFTGAPYQGIEATGRSVEIRGVDAFIEAEDGLIRHNTIYYDGAAFARDIGLLPARGSRGEKLLLAVFNTWTRLKRLFRRPGSGSGATG